MLTDALSNGGFNIPHIAGEKAKKLIEKLYKGSSVANPIDRFFSYWYARTAWNYYRYGKRL